MVIKINKTRLYFFILFLYVMSARTFNLVSINIFVATIFTIYTLFLKKDVNLFYSFIIFLIPNLNLFLFNGVPLINILIVVSMVWLIFFEKIYLNDGERKFLIIIIFFIVYDLIHFLFNNYFNMIENIILYSSIVASFFFYVYQKKSNSIEKYVNPFICGTIGSLISGLLFMISTDKLANGVDITNRNLGNAGDPNYLGLYILISITFLINQIRKDKLTFKKLIIIIFLAIGGFSTSSRTFMLILIVELLPFIYTILRDFIVKFQLRKIILIGVGIVIIIFFLTIFNENIRFIFERFNDASNLDELTNGRSDIALTYLNKLATSEAHLLFGFGISKYPINMEIFAYAHNAYVEILVTVGIIGMLLIIFLIIYFLYTHNVKIFSMRFLPVIIFLFIAFGINIVEVECFYFLFALLINYSLENNK